MVVKWNDQSNSRTAKNTADQETIIIGNLPAA